VIVMSLVALENFYGGGAGRNRRVRSWLRRRWREYRCVCNLMSCFVVAVVWIGSRQKIATTTFEQQVIGRRQQQQQQEHQACFWLWPRSRWFMHSCWLVLLVTTCLYVDVKASFTLWAKIMLNRYNGEEWNRNRCINSLYFCFTFGVVVLSPSSSGNMTGCLLLRRHFTRPSSSEFVTPLHPLSWLDSL
jgi:hypothetical protein